MSATSAGDGSEQNANLQTVHDNMLDGLGQLSNYFGFPKVMGQIFGALLMADRPLCLDDLVERLDISKATASMNVRTIENMGMVRQVWVRGSSGKRKYYEAETDFWQIITNILSGRELRDVDRALTVMEENVKRLKASMPDMTDENRQLAEVYIDRIARMQGLFRFAQLMIETVLAKVAEADLQDISRIEIG